MIKRIAYLTEAEKHKILMEPNQHNYAVLCNSIQKLGMELKNANQQSDPDLEINGLYAPVNSQGSKRMSS